MSRRSIKSSQALKRGWVVALVMSLMMGLGLSGVVSAPAIAATTQDGLAITFAPSPLPVRKVASDPGMTLKVTDSKSAESFTTYTLSGVPAGWQVLLNGAPLTAVSPQPLLYSIPKADALAGKVTIVPPIGYSGAPELSLTRVMATSNLITDFDNGTFNYIGTAAPQLPTIAIDGYKNTDYTWDDPRTYGAPMHAYRQLGPYDGSYSIWPTARLRTTEQYTYQDRYTSWGTLDAYNNKWADIRSVTDPMTDAAYSSATACSGDYVAQLGSVVRVHTGDPVSDATAAASGKFLIVNGSLEMPVPNNLVYTTITGLKPNTWYTFSGYTANLSYDTKFTNPVQTALYIAPNADTTGTLVGSSQPLPKQSSCTNSGTSMWTYNTGTWYSGDATQVTLGVRNFGDGGFGNDLAIDQLSFTESATATATATVSVVTTPTPTPTAPTTTKFDCGGTGIYDLNGKTWLFPQLDTTNATLASVADKFTNAPPVSGTSIPANALAINADGTKAYATSTGTKSVFMYNAADGTTTKLGAFTDASGAMPDGSTIMGAINPVNGWYYVGFALYNPTDTVPKTARIDFYAWDPVTGNKGLQFYLSVPIDANDGYNMQGDLAFDSEGRAYIVNGIQRDAYILDTQGKRVSNNPEAYWENVITIVDAVPSNGSRVVASRTIPLDWTEGPFNGIAFGGDGFLYVQSALYDGKTNYLSKVDPSTGAVGAPQVITDPVGTTNADGTVTPVAAGTTAKAQYNTDLASCSYPSTLKLQKDIVGRTGSDDQFKLSILGTEAKSDGTFPTIASGTTFGSTLGVQSATEAVAGAVSGVPGRKYTLQESAVNADLADYVATWECVDTARKEADGSPVSVPVTVGEGGTASVTMPSPPAPTGSHVVCTVTNTPEAEEPVLETAVPITVEKQGLNCDTNESTCPLNGAEFALYDKDPSVAGATPIVDGIKADSLGGSTFTSMALKNGSYWLVETKAPTGHTLLATPVQFNMCTFVQGAAPASCLTGNGGAAPTEGITLVGTTSPLVTVVNDTTNQVFKMVVSDPTASPLPQAGGSGPWESVVIALLLMGAAATSYRVTSGRRLAPRR